MRFGWVVSISCLLAACGDDGASPADASSSTTEGVSSTGPGSTSVVDGTMSDDSSTGGGSGSTAASTDGSSSSGEVETGSTTGVPNDTHADPRGYTLVAPLGSRFTYLFDADGQVINSWESEATPANSAYMLPSGHLLRVARDPDAMVELASGVGGIVQQFDWDGTVVWQYEHVGPNLIAHHDIEPLPNGNVLIIAYEMFSVEEAVAAGRDPAELSSGGLWSDFIVEVDPRTDQIVWEWHVWDHLVQDFDPLADNYDVVGDRPERIDINWVRPGNSPRPDWTHINAVAYNEALDQIVLSPRTFSEIWIIDHSTTTAEAASSVGGDAGRGGDLLYRWGNPATYEAGDPVIDRQLWFQHDPRWIAAGKPGADHLLVFDNGDPLHRPYSRVIEIDTPVGPGGTYPRPGLAWGPSEPAWVYEDPKSFFALFVSGADRLTDGRTLVCSGPTGELFEVDAAGTTVWSYALRSGTFRAERYEADYPAWAGLSEEQLAPKGPLTIELEG